MKRKILFQSALIRLVPRFVNPILLIIDFFQTLVDQ